jgi:hypothetical protein
MTVLPGLRAKAEPKTLVICEIWLNHARFPQCFPQLWKSWGRNRSISAALPATDRESWGL